MPKRKVIVLPYDPRWEQMYFDEVENLKKVLGQEIITTHHMGSTAIEGVSAKPIIDILVVVRDIRRVELYNEGMAELGYQAMGEYGISGRRFYRKPADEYRTHHVHIYQEDSPEIERHLAFRDYLRTHPADANAYSQLKTELALKYPEDMQGYIDGKDQFIKGIDKKALSQEDEPTS